MNKVNIGWCKVHYLEDEEVTWTIGNVREVGKKESRVEVPQWDEETCIETIEEWHVPNEFIEMKEEA
tara:strand:+ start:11390 stop:11590 length:201 start_codon:yes stop_codon:yes gene_type:complete